MHGHWPCCVQRNIKSQQIQSINQIMFASKSNALITWICSRSFQVHRTSVGSMRCLCNQHVQAKSSDYLENHKSYIKRVQQNLKALDKNNYVQNLILRDLNLICDELQELIHLQNSENDQIKELIAEECEQLNSKTHQLIEQVIDLLAIDKFHDVQEVIIELEHAVGGVESMLFVKDMTDFYFQFAHYKGWQITSNEIEHDTEGGIRSAKLWLQGKDVFKLLRHEAGVHRVQRIPKTERSGRIHTSTIAVQVVPIFKQEQLQINKRNLKIETMRAQGPGGQHLNKTETCVRITHIPTGIAAECQEHRSQDKNKQSAIEKIRLELSRRRMKELRDEESKIRRSQVNTVERSDKIRTYNYLQDRVTEHRLREDMHNLKGLMKGECHQVLNEWQERLNQLETDERKESIASKLNFNTEANSK